LAAYSIEQTLNSGSNSFDDIVKVSEDCKIELGKSPTFFFDVYKIKSLKI
jgi:hypothetical protein